MATHQDLWHDKEERLALHSKVKTTAALRPTSQFNALRSCWAKNRYPSGEAAKGNWECETSALTEYELDVESERCLKCADAPCIKGCPASVDVHSFIYALSKHNVYEAARVIYTDNPMGITCGLLCSTDRQCRSTCNLRGTHSGPIDIGALQRYACETFLSMRVPQVVPPPSAPGSALAEPVALIGAGPASISCATFLARLGHKDVQVFEAAPFAGGVPAWIPEYRIPYKYVRAEVGLSEELGVKYHYGQRLGHDAVAELRKRGFNTVFIGAGLPNPICPPVVADIVGKAPNVYTAAHFLRQVAEATKDLGSAPRPAAPQLKGGVLVLGGGDVAFNCAGAAIRCGASRATIAFREDMLHRPCCNEELESGVHRTRVEIVTDATPVGFKRASDAPDAPITHVVLRLADWDKDSPSMFCSPGDDGTVVARCDHVIVAFGSSAGAFDGLDTEKNGMTRIDPSTNQTSVAGVFAGGDAVGSMTIVKSVNDGKTAALFMHKHILAKHNEKVSESITLPPFRTVIDDVDVSVDFLGLHFINPFGLSSATPTGSVGQIRRSFEMGWGFAVTKTMLRVPATNVSPRIGGAPFRRGAAREGFVNMELLTEKTVQYWIEGIKVLKRDYPKHIVICSIMAPVDKGEWEFVTKAANESGADAIEMNLSCPHVGKKGMGMLAGQSPDTVREVTSWVRAVTKLPLIVKLTPNVTDITAIAAAAKAGGADAVTAINTVSCIMENSSQGAPKPNVGLEKGGAFGGLSGDMIRPIALRAVTAIRRAIPDLPILATGGCDSAEAALQFIYAGAPLIQITSAIQNQDYSIIGELVSGLRALLYMRGRPDLSEWRYQIPPQNSPASTAAVAPPASTPAKIASLLGKAAEKVLVVPQLDLEYQVRASVDDSHCLRCGKCYMSCNDTGYHAIELDPNTHVPKITTDCMGCGLCASVCPVNCITYVRKDYPHAPCRGIPDASLQLPFDSK